MSAFKVSTNDVSTWTIAVVESDVFLSLTASAILTLSRLDAWLETWREDHLSLEISLLVLAAPPRCCNADHQRWIHGAHLSWPSARGHYQTLLFGGLRWARISAEKHSSHEVTVLKSKRWCRFCKPSAVLIMPITHRIVVRVLVDRKIYFSIQVTSNSKSLNLNISPTVSLTAGSWLASSSTDEINIRLQWKEEPRIGDLGTNKGLDTLTKKNKA